MHTMYTQGFKADDPCFWPAVNYLHQQMFTK